MSSENRYVVSNIKEVDSALKAVEKRYGTAGLKKALEENPRAILSDIDTEQLEPFLS